VTINLELPERPGGEPIVVVAIDYNCGLRLDFQSGLTRTQTDTRA